MKKMIPLLLAAHMLGADLPSLTIEQPSSGLPKNKQVYVDFGGMMIVPQLGVGFREQTGYWGYDLTLKGFAVRVGFFDTEGWLPVVSAGGRLLYYPKPNLKGQWYVGGGVTSFYFVAPVPNLVFGKSYQTAKGKDRFWQISTDIFPVLVFPIVSFSYGVSL